MSSIVTGEAVVLELRPASFAARSLSALIDVVTIVLLYILSLLVIFSTIRNLDQAAGTAIITGLLIFYTVIVPVTLETLTRGKSLGKYAMGLRVVRDDGGSIRFRQALIRGLLGFFEFYMSFGTIAFLVSIFNQKSKRLGDLVAGTYAMRGRVPATPELRLSTPPYLLGWSQLADIARLPDGLARRISQFLNQAPKMTPVSRDNLARSLADEASGWVSPPPPAGTMPDAFLVALSVERRERDYRRLIAAKVRSDALGARLNRLPFE
ncbi:putative RDD family membrane protein YckC [Psychromicrobium silvestre]|uniref:Putative RDD family membrane protein YckC n=1 Tax=Psychromicrobium silvestre TaxID=1645614 RepID=A0A7Y9LW05_9MICC|nr:RDD family protein [Psychromicrobium silvestre]NYE96555.1 putative RDD family membrane protein YckC [Psychromicrobium silvestre]